MTEHQLEIAALQLCELRGCTAVGSNYESMVSFARHDVAAMQKDIVVQAIAYALAQEPTQCMPPKSAQ